MKSSANKLAYMAEFQKKPSEVAKRVARNAARRDALRSGAVQKGDSKEIDHKKPLSKGGSNDKSNLRVVSRHANRTKGKGLINH